MLVKMLWTRIVSLLVVLTVSLIIFYCFYNLQNVAASQLLIIIEYGCNNCSAYMYKHTCTYLLGA